MKVIHLGEKNSVINLYMSQLRNVEVQGNRTLFRRNLQRIARLMAYEVSHTLQYSEKQITTPLGKKSVATYDDHIVVGTVLRAGLAFHEGFLDVFDQADSAFVAAYREEGNNRNDLKIHVEYLAAPSIEGTTFLMVDPMLATGGSLELSYKAFLKHGTPKTLHICSVIAAQEGIEHLKRVFPDDVTLWVAAIDPELNDEAYIVPGLGDAGDLSFGEKL